MVLVIQSEANSSAVVFLLAQARQLQGRRGETKRLEASGEIPQDVAPKGVNRPEEAEAVGKEKPGNSQDRDIGSFQMSATQWPARAVPACTTGRGRRKSMD